MLVASNFIGIAFADQPVFSSDAIAGTDHRVFPGDLYSKAI